MSTSTGRQRVAHTPNSKPKLDAIFDLKEEDKNDEENGDGGSRKSVLTEEELWARLDELEKLEELQDEQDRCTISFICSVHLYFNNVVCLFYPLSCPYKCWGLRMKIGISADSYLHIYICLFYIYIYIQYLLICH